MNNKVLLSCLLLLMAGCSSNGTSSVTSNSSSVVTYESNWGSEYAETIVGSLGEDIPYIECESFECVAAKDSFGDPLICLYVFFEEGSALDIKIEDYAQIARNNGYEVTMSTGFDQNSLVYYDVYYADKVINDTTGLELQFLLGGYNNRDCLGIFAYNYVYDEPNKWPTNLVTSLLGHDIPHLEDTGEYKYTYQIHPEGYIDMVISNVPDNAEELYINLLTSNDYDVSGDQYDQETNEYLGKFAYPQDKKHGIQFGVSQYGLEIYIYKF